MTWPTKLAFSAGGVAYRNGPEGLEVALINVGKAWTLPKGLIEKGEKVEEAAKREVKEETGLQVELEKPIGTIEYWFASPKEKVRYHKKVYFFLFRVVSGNTAEHDYEVEEVRFFTPEEALKTLTYPKDKEILQKALNLLKSGDVQAS